ncbi:hypothetical protein D3C71_1982500 [compost metagenome]
MGVILDHQHVAATAVLRGQHRFRLCRRLATMARQVQIDARALADLAVQLDMAA